MTSRNLPDPSRSAQIADLVSRLKGQSQETRTDLISNWLAGDPNGAIDKNCPDPRNPVSVCLLGVTGRGPDLSTAILNWSRAAKDHIKGRAMWAGILCNEVRFRCWLAQSQMSSDCATERAQIADDVDACASALRKICNVKSRTEFASNPDAALKFDIILTEYDADCGRIPRPQS